MPEFNITLIGNADADTARVAFELAVRTLREGEGDNVEGELVIDGVPYTADEVSAEADTEGEFEE